MCTFLTPQMNIPAYMVFPRFMLEYDKCTSTTKLIYMILLDRARLSQQNPDWKDTNNHVYLVYPIKDLAETIHKNETTIKNSLNTLENMGLIKRKRQGTGRPNLIYVKIPVSVAAKRENNLNSSQDNNSYKKQSISPILEQDQQPKTKYNTYGSYKNVNITDAEMEDLKKSIPDINKYIERLSTYMKSKGKNYPDHAATIKSWYARDGDKKTTTATYTTREYNDKEYDSL